MIVQLSIDCNVKCDVGPCHLTVLTVGDNLWCTLIFICDCLLNYSWSVLNNITMYCSKFTSTQLGIVSFLRKRNWTERKTSGAW